MVHVWYVDGFPQDLAYLDGHEQPKSFGNEGVCGTHTHELTALSLSPRGTMVATASTKVQLYLLYIIWLVVL